MGGVWAVALETFIISSRRVCLGQLIEEIETLEKVSNRLFSCSEFCGCRKVVHHLHKDLFCVIYILCSNCVIFLALICSKEFEKR